MDKWINKTRIHVQWNIIPSYKGRKFWQMSSHGWTLRSLCGVNESISKNKYCTIPRTWGTWNNLNSQELKAEWGLLGAGEKGNGELFRVQSSVLQEEGALEIDCTRMWTYLTLLNGTLDMAHFMCILSQFKKTEKGLNHHMHVFTHHRNMSTHTHTLSLPWFHSSSWWGSGWFQVKQKWTHKINPNSVPRERPDLPCFRWQKDQG